MTQPTLKPLVDSQGFEIYQRPTTCKLAEGILYTTESRTEFYAIEDSRLYLI